MHAAIIMDGNGRWAAQRGKSRIYGHLAGTRRVFEIIEKAPSLGVTTLTLFAFSTENWRRPAGEIGALFRLFDRELRRRRGDLLKSDVRINFLGRRDRLPTLIPALMQELEDASVEAAGLRLCIAIDYGGHDELVRAMRSLMQAVTEGRQGVDDFDVLSLADHLDTAGIPDPDVIIRTSGEQRLSNFMVWQCAYSELVFVDKHWPDFEVEDLRAALENFSRRSRRFGGLMAAANAGLTRHGT